MVLQLVVPTIRLLLTMPMVHAAMVTDCLVVQIESHATGTLTSIRLINSSSHFASLCVHHYKINNVDMGQKQTKRKPTDVKGAHQDIPIVPFDANIFCSVGDYNER